MYGNVGISGWSICLNSDINEHFFMMLLLVYKEDAWLKQNMSCWSVNSFDFALEKLHSHWSVRAIFPA